MPLNPAALTAFTTVTSRLESGNVFKASARTNYPVTVKADAETDSAEKAKSRSSAAVPSLPKLGTCTTTSSPPQSTASYPDQDALVRFYKAIENGTPVPDALRGAPYTLDQYELCAAFWALTAHLEPDSEEFKSCIRNRDAILQAAYSRFQNGGRTHAAMNLAINEASTWVNGLTTLNKSVIYNAQERSHFLNSIIPEKRRDFYFDRMIDASSFAGEWEAHALQRALQENVLTADIRICIYNKAGSIYVKHDIGESSIPTSHSKVIALVYDDLSAHYQIILPREGPRRTFNNRDLPRHILNVTDDAHFSVQDVRGDGSCFFYAVAFGLGSELNSQAAAQTLRAAAVQNLKNKPWISNDNGLYRSLDDYLLQSAQMNAE